MRRLSIACMFLVMGMIAVLPAYQQVQSATVNDNTNHHAIGNPLPFQNCFAIDPAMGSIMRNDHYGWAQQQDSARLINNLTYKIGLVFDCSSVNGDQLARSFGTMSSIVANYASNPACFNNDAGVVNRNQYAHERWARFKTRTEVRDSMVWKTASAFRCLDRNRQVAFFADLSAAVANVPNDNAGPASASNCRTESYSMAGVPPARPGQQVTVNYTAPSNHSAEDWIGIFRIGGDRTNLDWKRVPQGPCGYILLVAPGPGEYKIYYVISNSPNQMIPQAHLSVR